MNLILKYTLFSIPLIIVISLIIYFKDSSVTGLLYAVVPMLILYLFTLLFFKREVLSKLADHKRLSKSLIHTGETGKDKNDLEFKIKELNENLQLISSYRMQNHTDKDMGSLFVSLESITNRFITELDTAKVFKVNRNEFLGNVAHELRTPIFAIQLSIETLLDGAVNDKKVNLDFLNRAMKQAERLKELVDDLITISKIETGMKMSKRYFVLNDFLGGIINELKALAEKKSITIVLASHLEPGTEVLGDSERLKQVFINLIENSIKYTPDGGNINIVTSNGGKHVTVSIEDTGIGIPKKDIPRIFERFYRVDKDRSRERGGSGLGLSIVKHILEAHNSQISVESEIDKGSKFIFQLPK